jgi:hypothetical protein
VTAILLAAGGCAILCLSLARYDRAVTLRRWQFMLGAPEKRAIDSLRERMALDSTLARHALASAERSRDVSRAPDALTILQVALGILEDAGADRLTRLRAMSVYSRMVRAVRPVPVPAPAAFQGRSLGAVAGMTRLVERFLVGSQERFRLVLLMLGLGVRIVLRGGRKAMDAARRQPDDPRPWAAVSREIGDFETLDASHLVAFEALVASLSAVDCGERTELWARISGDTR